MFVLHLSYLLNQNQTVFKVAWLLVLNVVAHPFPYALRSALNCNVLIFMAGKYSKMLIGSETPANALGSAFTLLPCLSNVGIDHLTI